MAGTFTATLTTATMNNGTISVGVSYNDVGSGWGATKVYNFPNSADHNLGDIKNSILQDAQHIKSSLSALGTIQSLVGTTIII